MEYEGGLDRREAEEHALAATMSYFAEEDAPAGGSTHGREEH